MLPNLNLLYQHFLTQHRLTRVSISIFWLSYFGLLAVFTFTRLVADEHFLWAIWCLQCIPLLCFLPGLIVLHKRAFLWICFVILLYFIKAVLAVMSENQTTADILFLIFTIALFTSAMFVARWLPSSQHR